MDILCVKCSEKYHTVYIISSSPTRDDNTLDFASIEFDLDLLYRDDPAEYVFYCRNNLGRRVFTRSLPDEYYHMTCDVTPAL